MDLRQLCTLQGIQQDLNKYKKQQFYANDI